MPDLIPPLLIGLTTAAVLFIRWFLYGRYFRPVPRVAEVVGLIIIVGLVGCAMLSLGRSPTYANGPIRLWSGNIWSDQNSQQIADPYTITHITSGALFYGFLHIVVPQTSLMTRAVVALGIESGWEVFENTDFIINRYRDETLSLNYYGDSIINSIFDIFAALLGFFLAARLRVRTIILGIVISEFILLLFIRDSFFLNVLLLTCPIPAVQEWQLELVPKNLTQ